MTKPPAKAEVSQDSGASSILVWNGLVTRMRRIGGEKRNRARVDVDRSLERGREADARGTWNDADESLTAAHEPPLGHEYQFDLDTDAGRASHERLLTFLRQRLGAPVQP